MGVPVLILGESGSGKSSSLRNFAENEIGIFNVAGKPLPFKNKLFKVNGATYQMIKEKLTAPKLRAYAIDDSQYLMIFASFDRAKETGYGKFTDIALDFTNLVRHVISNTPADVIVYFLHHTEKNEDGKVKAKTSGKMIDTQLSLEGLFSIVLRARAEGYRYYFETQSDGGTTCKSPIKMFDREIENDLKVVDAKIREYWDLPPL